LTEASNVGQVQTFTYDARDRLLTAQTNAVGLGPYHETYGYDRLGNIITRTVGGEAIDYTYGRRHGLTLVEPTTPVTNTYQIYLPLVARNFAANLVQQPFAVVATSAGFRAGYDRNGNMLVRVEVSGTETLTYTQEWDVENRLSVVTNTVSGAVTRFVYDGDGTRVLREDAGGVTAYLGAVEVQITGTQRLTKTYYFVGGQRIAMREGDAVTYYGARLYSPSLGRFISADTIAPSPGNPQDLNRYSYVRNNPLKYCDPNGHSLVLTYLLVFGAFAATRVGTEYLVSRVPWMDRARRDQLGGGLVTNVADVIERESISHAVDPSLIGAVLRHESAALERRALTVWPIFQPGIVPNTAEFFQSHIQGDGASIGPAQMQLRRARELEELGYVTARKNNHQRRLALLGQDTAVEYVAGMLHYLSDQLTYLEGYADLGLEQRQRLLLIAYNWGWTKDFQTVLQEYGLEGMIDEWAYDNQTLDEYLRWKGEQ